MAIEELFKMKKNKLLKEDAHIRLQVRDDSNFLSPYSEEGLPIISSEIADFLEKSVHAYHPKQKIYLHIYSQCIDDKEKTQYQKAIRNYFELERKENTREIKIREVRSIIFTIIGVVALAFMFLCSHLGLKDIWIECIDIFAWVFLWEATDQFFIERSGLLARKQRLQNFIDMHIDYHSIE